jgi:hypothetical protein
VLCYLDHDPTVACVKGSSTTASEWFWRQHLELHHVQESPGARAVAAVQAADAMESLPKIATPPKDHRGKALCLCDANAGHWLEISKLLGMSLPCHCCYRMQCAVSAQLCACCAFIRKHSALQLHCPLNPAQHAQHTTHNALNYPEPWIPCGMLVKLPRSF